MGAARRFPQLMVSAVAVAVLQWAPAARAIVQIAPEFSHSVGTEGIGLRARYAAFAHVFGDSEFRDDGLTKLPLAWEESISFAGSVAAVQPAGEANSAAEFRALARVGKLGGITSVKVEK